ncbi:MAG: sugar transferase [Planctomycetes bacterium]|nr:sugar transferase [Planctomycetota bacterium]
MLRERDRLIQMQVMVVDSLIIISAFAASYWLRKAMPRIVTEVKWRAILPLRDYLWIPVVAVPLWLLAFTYCSGTKWLHGKRQDVFLSVAKPLVLCGVVMALINFVFKPLTVSRMMMGLFFVLCLVFFHLTRRLTLLLVAQQEQTARNLLIVGSAETAEEMAKRLAELVAGAFHIAGIATRTKLANKDLDGVPVLGTIGDLQTIIDENVIDDVIFADPLADLTESEEVIRICEEVGVDIHLQADFFNVILSKTYVEQFDGLPFLTYSSAPRGAGPLLIKRVMDVTLSLALLILLSPFLALIGLLIKRTSEGPILFRQTRAGLNGREFTLYKFRSMHERAEEEMDRVAALKTSDGPSFKAKDDPRVTSIGRLLRRFSLDELPQLWNVLKGDMSIVGPRPVPMHEVERYERWQRRRLSMKPGMTCLWQVSGRSDLAFSQWMKLDLRYIDQWSLWLDLKVLLWTIPAVIRGRGSY